MHRQIKHDVNATLVYNTFVHFYYEVVKFILNTSNLCKNDEYHVALMEYITNIHALDIHTDTKHVRMQCLPGKSDTFDNQHCWLKKLPMQVFFLFFH